MLAELLAYLRNWFVVPGGIHSGKYTVTEGGVTLPFVLPGQYFRIVGSVFNDGVYKYGDDNELIDETFDGAVWALAVPPAVIELAEEIAAWRTANPESAYTSESFGGYSYSKPEGASWQTAYKSRLRQWRKL